MRRTVRSHALCATLIFLVLLCTGATAQRFQNLNDRFPMPMSDQFFQDREGFLWITTQDGLARYDGYSVTLYTHKPGDTTSIPANNTNSITQDSSGRFWIGLRAFGVCILDSNFNTFTPVCLPDQNGDCLPVVSGGQLAIDSSGHIWIGTSHGLFKFSTNGNPQFIKRYLDEEDDTTSISGSYATKVFYDSHHRLWVGSTKGINLYDAEHDHFISSKQRPSFPDVQILDIAEDREEQVYITTRFIPEHIFKYDRKTGNFKSVPEFYGRELGEFKLSFDFSNNVWISSRGLGAYYYDQNSGEIQFYDALNYADHGYQNIYGTDNFTDSFGNTWFAGGLTHYWPATGKNINHINTYSDLVISIYADQRAIWYCSNSVKRVLRESYDTEIIIDRDLIIDIRRPDTRNIPRVYEVKDLNDEEILFTTTRNVFIWNKLTDKFRQYSFDYGGPFRDYAFTKGKKATWICGNQGRPILFDLATGTASRPDNVLPISNPRTIESDDGIVFWFGSYTDGLYRYDHSSGHIENFVPNHEDPDRRLNDYAVHDLAIDSNGIVWAATNLGLNRIDPASMTATSVRAGSGFPNESCSSLLVDGNNDLWIGTQSGLVRYQTDEQVFTHFTRSDGLINTIYTDRARFMDKDGILYFGGSDGIDIIDPKQLGTNNIPPALYIGKILVNNAPFDTVTPDWRIKKMELEHTDNFIEIELLALHYTSPESNRYAYRIPQINPDWNDLGTRRTITLANMRPGTYTIEAKASNADGVETAVRSLVKIRILPPWWLSWWFLTLLFLTIAAVIFALYKFRVGQIQKRERLKTEFNKRIAELESKALRAQMNPHFLFNSLNSVKSLISQGENEKATQYLTRFGKLIRQVLTNSEKPLVRLQEEVEALRLYLEMEKLRFQNFEFNIEVDDDVDADFIEVPPLVLQPYVENAIWHGLMHKTSGERNVDVKVSRDAGKLIMTVADNGIGRREASKLKMLGSARKGGMGMRLTSDRLKLLKDIYGQDVKIEVIDRFDDTGNPSGTHVRIIIPYPD